VTNTDVSDWLIDLPRLERFHCNTEIAIEIGTAAMN